MCTFLGTAGKINENDINLTSIENNEFLSKGSKINKIDILFKKIDKNND